MMFALWMIVFVGVFRYRSWVIPLAVVAIIWSVLVLRIHMTSPIDLNF